MKKKATFILMMSFILFVEISYGQQKSKNHTVLKGPYLGQKPPGMTPKVFAPGIVSTGMHEAAIAFSSDGEWMFFNVTHLTHGMTALVFMKQERDLWTKPQVAGFSGKFNDSDAFFSYDGTRLFFTSDRPVKDGGQAGNLDIWMVERNGDAWGAAENLGSVINGGEIDVNPCVTRNGNLYFASNRAGGKGSHDLYRSQLKNGKHTKPENLGDSINTSNFESSPFVSPDETYIIFNVFAGKQSEIKSGLHISFKNNDDSWSQAVHMGDVINQMKPAMFAFVTHDERYLFFTSSKVPYLPYRGKALNFDEIVTMFNAPQNGSGDIYWVDAKIIEDQRPKESK